VRSCVGVAGAAPINRVPDDGPVFFQGLRTGDSDVGVVADAEVPAGSPGRVLVSIEVDDVDAALPRVPEFPTWAARCRHRPPTCRGVSASPTSGTPTATR
jgi:hypothetical protein